MQSSHGVRGKNGFSLLAFCSSLMSIVLLSLLMASCSTEDDLTVATSDFTKNADGSITIHRISSVALPGGFTAATRAITSRAGETTEAVDEKTSWAEGDRLHIGITISSITDIHIYRYAIMQSDGSWLLNGDVTIPATGTCTIDFFYFGKKYNGVDFNDPTQNPDNIAKDVNNSLWAEGNAVSRMGGVYLAQIYKTADATTGITTYSDFLAAEGVCTNGNWDTTNSYYSVTANPANGVFSITMKHLSKRIGITACDLSALGNGASVASITAKVVTNKSGIPADYAILSLSPASSEVLGTQPSETTPWKVQLYSTYVLYIQSFVVTLTDGREIPVSVPNASGVIDGIGREMNSMGGDAYVYRLNLSPGSCTATPDANFTAPGWQTGETGAPIPLYSRKDLEAIAFNLGGNYILMNDIDLSGSNWTPLGKTNAEAFTGKFNGNGHKIIGMKLVSSEAGGSLGFFGAIKRGIVYNLHFSNCTLQTSHGGYNGTLAGGLDNGYVSNCSVTNGSLIDNTTYGFNGWGGGLIGSINPGDASVVHCRVSNMNMETSYNAYNLGGLIGSLSFNAKVLACYTDGCTIKAPVDLNDTNPGSVGGLMAAMEGAYVLGCYATNVCTTGSNFSNGALIGYISKNYTSYGNLASCYATNASGSEAKSAICKDVLERYSYVPLGATDYSSLVAATAASFTNIETVVLSSSGSLSIAYRTWNATGIWRVSEGATISQAPTIYWGYNGE